EAGSRRDGLGREGAHVRAVEDGDARVLLERPDELAVADVDGDDVSRAPAQEDVREPARGGAGVEGAAARDDGPALPQRVERPGKLVGPARGVLLRGGSGDAQRLGRVDLARRL